MGKKSISTRLQRSQTQDGGAAFGSIFLLSFRHLILYSSVYLPSSSTSCSSSKYTELCQCVFFEPRCYRGRRRVREVDG